MDGKYIGGGMYYGRTVKDEFLVTLLQSQLSPEDLRVILNSFDYVAGDYSGWDFVNPSQMIHIIVNLMNIMQMDVELVEKALPQEEQVDLTGSCDFGCCVDEFDHELEEVNQPDNEINLKVKVDKTELDDLMSRLGSIVEGYYEDTDEDDEWEFGL